MNRSTLRVILSLLVLPFCLRAAIEKDLGQSLAYFRVTDPQADQPALLAALNQPALVLDLRSLSADRDFAKALRAALAKPTPPRAVRLVLINSTTSGPVRAVFNDDSLSSIVTLGPRSLVVKADIEISISDEDDRNAFVALANGTPLEKLTSDSRDKRRYDEAKLVHDHANGVTPADAELPSDATDDSVSNEPAAEGKKAPAVEKKTEPAPVLDLVLERALQLHRSLVALKKL